MSRFIDHGDDTDPETVLARGRWQRNARAVLTSKRGRQALALLREALLALPEKRLIEGALCTVGGPARVPDVTSAEVDAYLARVAAAGLGRRDREAVAESLRRDRAEERQEIWENTQEQGCGVCANGALLWHLLVTRQGLSPDEAFAALPAVVTADNGDMMEETARIAEHDAGIAYTLAWELAYLNDETFRRMTPEERYEAVLGWVNALLDRAEHAPAKVAPAPSP